jgi:hypothetical protein
LEDLGRTRLSQHFFLRDFLHSEIAQVFGLLNVPDDPDLAIAAGRHLCEELLEPLKATFGDVRIRSGYRSPEVNALGNRHRLGCASNEQNYAGHIWDRRDAAGRMGATATVVIPWFINQYERGADWRALAWWIFDHLAFSYVCFYPKLVAFNIQWREEPERRIVSWIEPRGVLTRSGMANYEADHSEAYKDLMADLACSPRV